MTHVRARVPRRPGAFRLPTDTRALLFLGGAVALFFWPVWVKSYRFPMGGGDLWSQLYPVWSYVAEWLKRGIVPLWNTRMMAGDPIIAEPQAGLLNPMNWMLFLLDPIPGWLVYLRAVAPLWVAGAGLYLYLRRSPVWRLNPAPALIGGLAYMFSDPFVAHLGHPHFNDTLAWLPWILWGIDTTIRRKSGIVPTAFAVAALLLAGHAQAAIYALGLILAYALWQTTITAVGRARSGAEPRQLRDDLASQIRRMGRSFARLTLTALLAAAVAAPGLLPALERLPHTERAISPPTLGEYEAHLGMWRSFITPLYYGRNRESFWAPWDRVETGYIGFGALGLATLGLLSGPWSRRAFLAVVAVVSSLFALGTTGPIFPLVADLPLFDATWKTGRAIFVLSLVLAMAAAAGSQVLFADRLGSRRRVWFALAAITVAALILSQAASWSVHAPNEAAATSARSGLCIAALFLATTAALGLFTSGWPAGRAALMLLILGELVITGAWADVEPMPSAKEGVHGDTIAYLKADTGWFRVDVDVAARGLLSPASLMAEGFEVPQGTGNPMEIHAYTQFYWSIPHKGMPAYQLLGPKYVIVPKGASPGADGIWPVYTEGPLVDVHLNTHALPRAWLVHSTLPVNGLDAAYAHVLAQGFDPWRTATVADGPTLSSTGTGQIELLAYGPNRVVFNVHTTDPALLVTSDLLYPGWRALVDGRSTPIYATNGLFRGVVVPRGTHTLEMRFRPLSLRVGLGMLGMAILAIVLLHPRNRTAATPRTSPAGALRGAQVLQ